MIFTIVLCTACVLILVGLVYLAAKPRISNLRNVEVSNGNVIVTVDCTTGIFTKKMHARRASAPLAPTAHGYLRFRWLDNGQYTPSTVRELFLDSREAH